MVLIHPSKNINKNINSGPRTTTLHGCGSLPVCCWAKGFNPFIWLPQLAWLLQVGACSPYDEWKLMGKGSRVYSPHQIITFLQPQGIAFLQWPDWKRTLRSPESQTSLPESCTTPKPSHFLPPLAFIYVNSYALLYSIWLFASTSCLNNLSFSLLLLLPKCETDLAPLRTCSSEAYLYTCIP